MSCFFLKCKSITHALSAQKILLQNGVPCTVKKMQDGSLGCSYGICVSPDHIDKARRILRANGIGTEGVLNI